MGRNLQPRKEDIIVQHEFMKTTQGMKWKVGGGTLKGEEFDEEYIKAGTAVAVDDDGDVVPFDTEGGTKANAENTVSDDTITITGGEHEDYNFEIKLGIDTTLDKGDETFEWDVDGNLEITLAQENYTVAELQEVLRRVIAEDNNDLYITPESFTVETDNDNDDEEYTHTDLENETWVLTGGEQGDEIGDGYLLANDVVNDKESNYVVGLIMAGYVDEDKITFDNLYAVDKFKENTEGRIFFDIA